MKDTLTAATGAVVPFHLSLLDEGGVSKLVLGYAHCGMVAAARWIARSITPCLHEAVRQCPDYQIKVHIHFFFHFIVHCIILTLIFQFFHLSCWFLFLDCWPFIGWWHCSITNIHPQRKRGIFFNNLCRICTRYVYYYSFQNTSSYDLGSTNS